MPVIPFFRHVFARPKLSQALALVAASLVASCETGNRIAAPADNSLASQAGVERVIMTAYRAIGDRALREPDFRTLSVETYRGFAAADPSMSLVSNDNGLTVMRDGKAVINRPAPGNPADGRAWGTAMAEIFTTSVAASRNIARRASRVGRGSLASSGFRFCIVAGIESLSFREVSRNRTRRWLRGYRALRGRECRACDTACESCSESSSWVMGRVTEAVPLQPGV